MTGALASPWTIRATPMWRASPPRPTSPPPPGPFRPPTPAAKTPSCRPATPRASHPTTSGGADDSVTTPVTPAGAALVYSTYLGGSGDDTGTGIAVDALTNAYVTGYTASTNFPTTPGAFQTANAGGYDA